MIKGAQRGSLPMVLKRERKTNTDKREWKRRNLMSPEICAKSGFQRSLSGTSQQSALGTKDEEERQIKRFPQSPLLSPHNLGKQPDGRRVQLWRGGDCETCLDLLRQLSERKKHLASGTVKD